MDFTISDGNNFKLKKIFFFIASFRNATVDLHFCLSIPFIYLSIGKQFSRKNLTKWARPRGNWTYELRLLTHLIYDSNVWTLMGTFSNVTIIIFRKCMKVIFHPIECLIMKTRKICIHIFKGIFCQKKSWHMNFQFLL